MEIHRYILITMTILLLSNGSVGFAQTTFFSPAIDHKTVQCNITNLTGSPQTIREIRIIDRDNQVIKTSPPDRNSNHGTTFLLRASIDDDPNDPPRPPYRCEVDVAGGLWLGSLCSITTPKGKAVAAKTMGCVNLE